MSFSKELKEEISKIDITEEEMLAEMLAFLHLNSHIEKLNNEDVIVFKTKTPLVARRFLKILRFLYPAKTDVEFIKEKKLSTKTNIKITISSEVQNIISEHGLIDRLSDEKDFLTVDKKEKKAYLRGAFLSSGSVNSPENAEYHLEIFAQRRDDIIFIQRLMNFFNLNSKIIKRRNGYISYVKEAEKISDFLRLVGANNQLFYFEDLRIKRDMNNQINRLINCEFANQKKTSTNSTKLLKAISFLENIKSDILQDEKIKNVIYILKNNSESSLNELCDIYFKEYNKKISKSGLNHRFNKILLNYDLLKGKS